MKIKDYFTKKKFYISFIILLILINFLSWLIWGKKNSIILASDSFYTQTDAFIDSIYIFTDIQDQKWFQRTYYDYNANQKEKFIKRIERKTYYDKVLDPFYIYDIEFELDSSNVHNGDNEIYSKNIYSFFIIDAIPMYANVKNDMYLGQGSVGYSMHYIWFFGWHRIYGYQTMMS